MRILQAWRDQDWRAPALEEDIEQEEVCLRLTTISLFPPEVTEEMERRFPKTMHSLDENGRLALATAILEGRVTNERLQELTDQHPRDLTFLLKTLVKNGFLAVREKRRWSSYTLAPEETHKGRSSLPHKDGSLPHKGSSSQHKGSSSQHKSASSQHKDSSSQHKETEFPQKETFSVDENSKDQANRALPAIVQEIRAQKRSNTGKMEEAILILCESRYVKSEELADMLNRNMETLKNHYLSKLVRQGKLVLRFPGQLTHPSQGYRTAVTENKGETHES